MVMKQACIQISNQIPGLFGLRGALMNTSENKAQKKLIEIVLYMAGILMYHVNIFGINNLNDLNKKIGELLVIMQDEERIENEN
jgi:hypothetical protein